MSNPTKTKSAAKIKLDSFDDLFGNSTTQENLAEQIINVPLADLHTFKDDILCYTYLGIIKIFFSCRRKVCPKMKTYFV